MTTLSTQALRIQIGKQLICQALNIHMQAGEVWGILGPNGCGKTMLMHTLAGLRSPSGGKVLLNHRLLTEFPDKQRAQHLSILLQEASHFHATFPQTLFDYCAANRFPHLNYFQPLSTVDKSIIRQCLALLALDKPTTATLSGGEKQRLAIAAILTQRTPIYLLDEPTNHLDIPHQLLVLNHFQQLARAQSALIVMNLHNINVAAQYCSHIILLHNNGACLHGPREELLTSAQLSQLYQCHMTLSATPQWHGQLFENTTNNLS